jgi:hypothetical protein
VRQKEGGVKDVCIYVCVCVSENCAKMYTCWIFYDICYDNGKNQKGEPNVILSVIKDKKKRKGACIKDRFKKMKVCIYLYMYLYLSLACLSVYKYFIIIKSAVKNT